MPTASAFASTTCRIVVLWLALLLPAMQALAGWHAMSHASMPLPQVQRSTAEPGADDARAAKLPACEQCLALAGLANAAPAATPSMPAALHAAPVLAPVVREACAGVASLLAYQGRAPPFLLL